MAQEKVITLNTRVAFAREHLRDTGQFTGRAPFIRGNVKDIVDHGKGFMLACVAWDDGIVSWANVRALVRDDCLHLERG